MARIPGWLLRHQATVETYTGESGAGPVYAPPVTVRVFLDEQSRLIRDADGQEVVSKATIYARLDDAPTLAPGSRVTAGGRTATIVTRARRDDAGAGAWQHVEATLT